MEELEYHIKHMLTLLKTELRKEIEDCVKKVIDEKLKSIDCDSDCLITTPQLQKILSLSRSSIEVLKKNKMPFYKIGDNVRYKKQEVLSFIQQYNKKEGGTEVLK
jgi:predicted DNA-binding transcriptional regulator AlpA